PRPPLRAAGAAAHKPPGTRPCPATVRLGQGCWSPLQRTFEPATAPATASVFHRAPLLPPAGAPVDLTRRPCWCNRAPLLVQPGAPVGATGRPSRGFRFRRAPLLL